MGWPQQLSDCVSHALTGMWAIPGPVPPAWQCFQPQPQPWAQSQLQRQQLALWAASQFLPWREGQGASWKQLWAGSSPLAAPHGLFIVLCVHSAPVPDPGSASRHLT